MRKKHKKRRFNKILIGVIAAVAILSIGYLIYYLTRPPPPTFQYKAAIVDHLSHPDWGMVNQTFIDTSTAILETAGFSVDYYNWTDITVNFYKNLPSHGYGLIILRVHSAAGDISGTRSLALFTSEPYSSSRYVPEQVIDPARVVKVSFRYMEPPYYFGIAPAFVEHSMKGKFGGTVIILMGCDGLETEWMAKAFIEKGAKVYISWDKSVTAGHTDHATIRLLQHLVAENKTVRRALEDTMSDVGLDPQYESKFLYYPDGAGDLTISKIAGILTIIPAKTVSRTNKIRKFRLDE